jgi:hypothetical protein
MREQGDRGIIRELHKRLDRADRPLETATRSHVGAYLPNRYARILAKALKFQTRIKTTGRTVSVRLVVTAKGSKRQREIGRLDNPGILRHPVFGRYRYNKHGSRRKNPWVAQGVRPGFVSDRVDELRDQVRRDLIEGIHEIGQKITKG